MASYPQVGWARPDLTQIWKRFKCAGILKKRFKNKILITFFAVPRSLVYRASVPRIPCIARSYTVPRSLVYRSSVARIPCIHRSYPVPPWFVSRASVARIPCLATSYPVSPSLVCSALAVAADRFRKGFLALLGKMPRLGGCGLAFELHEVAIDGSTHLAFRGLLKLSKSCLKIAFEML